ncbi:MAG TPA: hypothetical protein DEP28_11220, partial [Bacteroidetes bacterium]|nr:hypothetical protein [Bacteroidota bacterium]
MKKLIAKYIYIVIIIFISSELIYSQTVKTWSLSPGNFRLYFNSLGIFSPASGNNMPGIYWPRNTQQYIIYTKGLSVAAMVNDSLAMTSASFRGEYLPGTVFNNSFYSDSLFKMYFINNNNSQNYFSEIKNWKNMVNYGAPFKDLNKNGIYDIGLDIAGVPNANQTAFICLSDANPNSHSIGEGFGGGIITPLLKMQNSVTIWGYDNNSILENTFFVKHKIINKSNNIWKSTWFTIFSEFEDANWYGLRLGTDTLKNLVYTYGNNLNSQDSSISAVGIVILKSPHLKINNTFDTLGLTSSNLIFNTGSAAPVCMVDANGEPMAAYYLMQGYKKNKTYHLNPTITSGTRKTKYVFSGNPLNNIGWTEFKGMYFNCDNDTNFNIINYLNPNTYRRSQISSGHDSLDINPGDTIDFTYAVIAESGINNREALKNLFFRAKNIKYIYNSIVDENIWKNSPVSTTPDSYELTQNFPNPFNPET